MTNAREALARRRENGEKAHNSLADEIRKMAGQYQLAMPKGAEATQLVRDALTALRATPKLAEAEHQSVLGGLMTCAQLGLRVGVLGHAWLVPFWDYKIKGQRAQLIIGYQGYAELAFRSGKILSLASRTVFDNDEFDLYYAPQVQMRHRPTLDGPRGNARLYYAAAEIQGGGFALTDPMTVADMEAHRDKYATAKNKDGQIVGPWVSEFEGMAQKTMVRRLAKLLPKSTDLAIAIQADEGVRLDLNPKIDAAETTQHPEVWEGEARPTSGPPAQDRGQAEERWPEVATPPPAQ